DAIQEAWLRLDRADVTEVENVSGWVRTVVARGCLERLRSRRSRLLGSPGGGFPEPLVGGEAQCHPSATGRIPGSGWAALRLVREAPARVGQPCCHCSVCSLPANG